MGRRAACVGKKESATPPYLVYVYYLGVVQWVERYIWDVEVARSSRAIQTNNF